MSDPTPTEQPAAAAPGWWTRLSAWGQRIPTGWFASILTGVFLAVTAAFGGLAPVAEAAVESLAAGEPRVGAQLGLSVERAVLFDSFPQSGAYAGEGERVLALLINAENRWSEPLLSSNGAIEQALRVEGLGEALDDAAPAAVARLDDATLGPWLQPGVPAELVVTWVVPAASVAEGDTVSITIREAKLEKGQRLTSDARWTSPAAVATVELEVIAGDADPDAADPDAADPDAADPDAADPGAAE